MEQAKPLRKPGELGFCALCFLFGAAGYYFALDMTSGELSSPSMFPKLSSVIIMLCAAGAFVRTLKGKAKVDASFNAVTGYLFSKDVVVMLVLLAAYSVALPILHFAPASAIFLFVALFYLQRFKRAPMCLAISVISIAILVAGFTYIFKVMLP